MSKRTLKPRTDFGTIALHWSLVASLIVSVLTGLRIAADAPDAELLKVFAFILPANNIWYFHIIAGAGLLAVAAAYPVYLWGSGLTQRIKLDGARLSRLRAAPWAAVNVALYWLLFALLAAQVVTGVMLHRGFGGAVVEAHLFATWMILLYAAAHVAAHFAHGGMAQLLRVIRPAAAPGAPAKRALAGASGSVGVAAVTAFAALAALVGWFKIDNLSRDVLRIAHVAAAPPVAGDLSDPAWRAAEPLSVRTQQGVNLDGSGESSVEIRAVHDGERVYFAFTWQDSTRSTKHFPLIKGKDGWHALMYETQTAAAARAAFNPSRRESSIFEGAYAEDKFSVMLSAGAKPFGPGAFHPGAKPLADKPASSSGRGLHYTVDGSSVDAWLWHAAAGPAPGRCEADHIGGPQPASEDQAKGIAPYKGGIAGEPGGAVIVNNYRALAAQIGAPVVPLRLPTDLAASQARTGPLTLDSDLSDPESARWAMSEADSAPYTPLRDEQFPIGAVIPGVLTPDPRPLAAGDVQCAARWAANRWTLVASRKLDTGRAVDTPVRNGTQMFVAVFDHTVAGHTRHIRSIQLELAP